MAVISEVASRALRYWGSILASARSGANIQNMWNAIREQQQQYGLPSPGASAADVMVLRGYANKLINAERQFASANPDYAISSSMIGIAPYTDRSYESINTDPTYKVSYLATIQTSDGTTAERYITSMFSAQNMPSRVGDLQAELQLNADEIAANPESNTLPMGDVTGISQIQIAII